MKKKNYVKIICGITVLAFLCLGDKSIATNFDSQIEEAEQEQKKFEKKADKLEKEIEEIEADKEDTLAYIEKLDKKTVALEGDIEALENQISQLTEELKKSKNELTKAEAVKEEQYITMKKRIKYMYENGNGEYWEMLFSAESLTDMLNRAEYIEKLSAYDKKVFEEYKKTIQTIETKKKEIEDNITTTEGLREESLAEKAALEELNANKQEELAKYNSQIDVSQEKKAEYEKKAADAEAEVEELLLKKQKELEKQRQESGQDSYSGGDGTLRWPLMIAGRISSYFGPRTSPTAGASSYHKGIDIAAASGTPIVAAGDGSVIISTYSSSAGNYIMLSHGNGLYTVYMHCSRLLVGVGENVKKGQQIATVGSTGISTGAHLHFGVSVSGEYVNPLNYVSQ